MKPGEVLLFNMPFVSLARPAIGASMLKAKLQEEGIGCEVAYPNLLLAKAVGVETYRLVDDQIGLTYFVGDWLFAQDLFGGTPDREAYLDGVRSHVETEEEFRRILAVEKQIPEFLGGLLDHYRVGDRRLIGFSSTFQQNLASLALAKRIKERFPHIPIAFGGSNCEGRMGQTLHECFPWVDYVFDGEADESFPALVQAVISGRRIDNLAGFHCRENGVTIPARPPARVLEMDSLPDPDYSDYFAALDASGLRPSVTPALLIETARGCWWGAKRHCTFCGLNGASMAFRSKSPERVLAELKRQLRRWNVDLFMAVDNILDQGYFNSLLPKLREKNLGIRIFYEVKSNLKRKQVKLLAESGVYMVQPGIESLSTRVLGLMDKGVSGLQNVQLLKWCLEYGVSPMWNLLYGFPGETAEDYAETAEWMEALTHLTPPHAVGRIRLDRFSPYFDDPGSWGLRNVRPASVYRCIYGLPPETLANLVYFFEFDYPEGQDPDAPSERARAAAHCWQQSPRGSLTLDLDKEGRLILTDARAEPALRFVLEGIQKRVYLYCDQARTTKALIELVRDAFALRARAERWLESLLGELVRNKLMIHEGDRYLSVAVASEPSKLEYELEGIGARAGARVA